MHDQPTVPAVLYVDAEPDHLQIARTGVASWAGFEAMYARVEQTRERLFEATGVAPSFCWGLRMDPQIELTHGRADYVASTFGDQLARLGEHGDTFGIHPHALRWSEQYGEWVHDYGDREWVLHCVDTSAAAFEGVFGRSPVRHRSGGNYLADDIVAHLDRMGFRVDASVHSGQSRAMLRGHLRDIGGGPPDMQRVPRRPYEPSVDDFRRADARSGRSLVLIPLSATSYGVDRAVWWRAARSVRHRFQPPLKPLWPSKAWQGPEAYWDEVERHLETMPDPYLAIAARTDEPGSLLVGRVNDVLDGLPDHPIAQRLRFVDPLDLARSFGFTV